MKSTTHRGRVMAAALSGLFLVGTSLAGAQSAAAAGNASVDPITVTILGPDHQRHPDRTTPYDTTKDSIAVQVVLANTGSVDIENVTVVGTDPVACPATTIAAGASMTCTAELAPNVKGEVIGQVDVKAVDAEGVKLLAGGLFYGRCYTEPLLSVYVVNTLGGEEAVVGTPVQYIGTVTNEGPSVAQNVRTTFWVGADTTFIPLDCPKTTLQVGESMDCPSSRPYLVTAEDAARRQITAVIMAEGDPYLPPISGTWASALVAKENSAGAGALTPSGQPVTWDYTVLNTGDVTLTGVQAIDDKLAAAGIDVTCPSTTLAPGAFMVCRGTHTPTDGEYVNTVTVTSTEGAGDDDSWTATIVNTGIALNKTATLHPADATRDHQDVAQVGDTIGYTFDIANTGNVPLRDVAVSDAMLATANVSVTCPATALAVGDSMTCTSGEYTVTSDDVAGGTIVNTAVATGTPATDLAYPDVTATAHAESGTVDEPDEDLVDDPDEDPGDAPYHDPVETTPAIPDRPAASDPTTGTDPAPAASSVAKTTTAPSLARTGAPILPLLMLTVIASSIGGALLLVRMRLTRGHSR